MAISDPRAQSRWLRLLGHGAPVLLLLALVAAAAAQPLAAASFVMVPDAALADQAGLIVEGTVVAIGLHEEVATPPPGATSSLATDYQVRVERLLKGVAPAAALTVRVPGGRRAAGLSSTVAGAPRFGSGERLLLFLEARADGSYRILHLFLGAFHLVDRTSPQVPATIALRSLAGATQVTMGGGEVGNEGGFDRPRDYQRFAAWLAARAAGGAPPADYFVTLPAAELSTLTAKFTLFLVDGTNMRWFEFDSGGAVPFYADQTGQSGIAGGGFDEFQTSLRAWDDNPGTFIHLAYAGTTAQPGSLGLYNSLNEVTFDDPAGELSTFDCVNGGVLAFTQTFWYTAPSAFKGVLYAPMAEAHIVTARNIGCFFGFGTAGATPSDLMESMLTHELGHAVGLNHSCGDANSPSCADPILDDAIMNAFVHTDARGARLGADDKAAIQLLYSNVRVPAPRCKPDAHTLCLAGGRFEVTVDWSNQFNSTSGAAGAIKGTDAAGYFYFSDPTDVELMFKILDLNGIYKVFYGELTNLHFTINVRDLAHYTAHSYSNTAGDCGGIDETAFGAVAASKSGGSCRPSATTLCLLNGRFAVSVKWSNPGNSTSGAATGKLFSSEVGTFVFTDPGNIELMTKLIQFPDRITFFWGALTDLAYTITVTDTTSGTTKTYQGADGKLCGGLDNDAF
jgi:hypothetical protein